MANPWRGEVALVIDGHEQVLKLTLGALAELESTLGEDTLVGLAGRFESQRFSSRDIIALLEAGLRGGGGELPEGGLAQAEIAGGPMAAARAAAELLARAFTLPET
ncbi:gene transfer agent family protein [Sulfitobacter sp. D35]|uniref:gene transfer agent family protein n=1 Tax=Sulfitobacter sp. D35 TaxID=3083252 RepID=UPI00296E91FC|nr:gene transfer agent family protein [Sulfitobacter sp. D35]MDW4496813.1 gene transfer agent family protein [Sulfitobacter sp. D35]